jgi:uncharacterized membrane protein YbhN (UPF0104 family)
MIRMFARTLLLASLGVSVLLVMNHYGLFAFASVARAFHTGWPWILAVIGTQVALAFLLMFRYGVFVGLVGVRVDFPHLASANFVSNAVGQWAPGALAVTEVLRMSLMLGAERAQGRALEQNGSRLALASLFDRLNGFFTMLVLGGVSTLLVVSRLVGEGRPWTDARVTGLVALAVFSLSGAFAIIMLPFVARSAVVHAALDTLQVRFKGAATGAATGADGTATGPASRAARIVGRAQSLLRMLGDGVALLPQFLWPLTLSAICMALSCMGLYFAAFATGGELPLFAVVSTFSIIAISTLFPLGFGGLGGYQLVAVGVFGLFGVAPAVVSSASVLQSALMLTVNTLLGALYAHHSGAHVGAILRGAARSRQSKTRP